MLARQENCQLGVDHVEARFALADVGRVVVSKDVDRADILQRACAHAARFFVYAFLGARSNWLRFLNSKGSTAKLGEVLLTLKLATFESRH